MGLSSMNEDILNKRVAFLRKVPLFSTLCKKELTNLAENFHSRSYRRKEIIFHQGDDSQAVYVVMRGKVRIYSVSPAGHETSFRIFSAHDVLGEFSAIDGEPRSSTAQAADDCTLLEIEHTRFLRSLREMPELATALVKMLVKKLRWTTVFAETIAQYDTAGRLLHTLLYYKEEMGKEIVPGKRYLLDLSISQTELASLIGARREWVNRLLQEWRKQGLIDYARGKITILDLPAMEEERDRSLDLHEDMAEW